MGTTNLEERLDRIIKLAYEITCQKIAGGLIRVDNEASFQLHLGTALKTLGEQFVYKKNEHFETLLEHSFDLDTVTNKCKNRQARCDIMVMLTSGQDHVIAIIELKFFKKANHREPNSRYDFFADLENLEQYQKQGASQLNYEIIGTDHPHYYDASLPISDSTADFRFREGDKYIAGTKLHYGTNNPYGGDIILQNDYLFHWEHLGEYSFMKIKIN